MSEERKPHVFQVEGKWRSRMQDDKGRWRTFKFEEGKHEPGMNGESPPTTPSGAFVTIPKAIRDTKSAQIEEPEPKPVEPPQVEPVAQNEPAQIAQPETPQPEPAKESSGFPPFCADATRSGSVSIVEQVEPAQTERTETAKAPNPSKIEIPMMEMLIDTMFQVGEGLGGPAAPKGSASQGISLEALRDTMVQSGKEAFPFGEVEAGPKTTFFGCMGIYFFMCANFEKFRENTQPWWLRMKGKFAAAWMNFQSERARKKAEKRRAQAEAESQTEPEEANA